MPIYEYTCPKCKKVSEHIVKMGNDGSDLECPKCAKKGLTRISMSRFSVSSSSAGSSCDFGGACPSAHACNGPSCCKH